MMMMMYLVINVASPALEKYVKDGSIERSVQNHLLFYPTFSKKPLPRTDHSKKLSSEQVQYGLLHVHVYALKEVLFHIYHISFSLDVILPCRCQFHETKRQLVHRIPLSSLLLVSPLLKDSRPVQATILPPGQQKAFILSDSITTHS